MTPDELGRYLYCVVQPENASGLALKGIESRVVSLVADGDLGVLVSPSAVKRYRLSRQYTLAHEAVIEQAMAAGTVLPIKFGTVAETENAIIEKVLHERGDDLRRLMAQMHNRVEVGVKVLWVQERIYADVVERSTHIRELRDRLAGLPPSEGHYDRVRLGEMVEAELTDRRQEDAETVMAALSPLAVDTRRNDVYGEMMILNAAFLIDRDRMAEFEAAVEAVDQKMGGLVTIKYVGPLPPFNFVDLVITWN